jgi:hypothetical protein
VSALCRIEVLAPVTKKFSSELVFWHEYFPKMEASWEKESTFFGKLRHRRGSLEKITTLKQQNKVSEKNIFRRHLNLYKIFLFASHSRVQVTKHNVTP